MSSRDATVVRRRLEYRALAGLCLGVLCGLGCAKEPVAHEAPTEEEQKKEETPSGDEKKLAQAMAAAATAESTARPGQAEGEQPPPKGIFEASAAEQLLKAGETRVTLGDSGANPKMQLSATLAKPLEQRGQVQLGLASDTRGGIPVDVQFRLNAKPTQSAAKPGMGAAAAVTLRVESAALGRPDPGAAALNRRLAQLGGSQLQYGLNANGASHDLAYQASKGVDEQLLQILYALGEVVSTATLPYPEEPVGAGAYWMAMSRSAVMGVDTLTYRLVKLEKIVGTQLHLKVNVRRYAVKGDSFTMVGLRSRRATAVGGVSGGR